MPDLRARDIPFDAVDDLVAAHAAATTTLLEPHDEPLGRLVRQHRLDPRGEVHGLRFGHLGVVPGPSPHSPKLISTPTHPIPAPLEAT